MRIEIIFRGKFSRLTCLRSHGVMINTLDFELSYLSSNLGGTLHDNVIFYYMKSFGVNCYEADKQK